MPVHLLLHLAAPYRYQLISVTLLTLANSLIMLVLPWLGGRFLGGLIQQEGEQIGTIFALLLLSLALIAGLSFSVTYISSATTAMLLAELRLRIYKHLQALPIGFHEHHRQGDMLALMTYEVASLSHFISATLVTLPAQLLLVGGAVVFMAALDAQLALLVPLLVPAFYLILKIIGRRLRGLAKALQEAEAGVVAIAEENLEMLPAIKAFTREDLEAARYSKQVGHSLALLLQQARITAALQPSMNLVAGGGAIFLLLLAGKIVEAGGMTPTGLFSFLFYAALLTRPVGALAQVYGQMQTSRGTLARMQSVLCEAAEPGHEETAKLTDVRGRVTFENVGFSYNDRDPTLCCLNLEISAGEIIALTGSNGAGKSTLVKLLLRYYEPSHGKICIDGIDISSIAVRDLRSKIGFVPQRAQLFNGTIRENISFGKADATDAEIREAAKLAQAESFIASLSKGLYTQIGDHGVRLSGGQRQRIALARAILKNPPILIFDEATSMFDIEGESAFITSCVTALKGRTVMLITHRSASLTMAHRIIRLEGGVLVDE